MSDETLIVSRRIDAPAEAVFAILADPSKHAAIDGTGWVRDPLDAAGERITAAGQVFGMAMYHELVPSKDYEMSNLVTAFEPPRVIAWEPGQYDASGNLGTGGWVFRYDLAPVGDSATEVTLTYDWSRVGPGPREYIQFPPFPPQHLERSLGHLAELATAG